MYRIEFTHQYLKDLKVARRRNLDEIKLNEVIKILLTGENLPVRYQDHLLKGEFRGMRDCHIENNWILIYEKKNVIKIIRLIRTGTHSDLFG